MGRADSRRRKRDVVRDELRYKRKSVSVLRRRQDSVRTKWEDRGWELEQQRNRRFRTYLAFKRALPKPRWGLRIGFALLALVVVAGFVVGGLRYLPQNEPTAAELAQADAAVALRELRAGDLAALEPHLAAHRGNHDFAYYFAAQTTPRDLGDALSTVAGADDDPIDEAVDAHEYDITLTDLAGVLALATHGTGDRMLPPSWTDDFATATTTPDLLYGSPDDNPDADAQQRADQDIANKQNLLLLLSRGYWSTEFLETVTDAYWVFDHDDGDDAWPGIASDDAKYAPAPTGTYLTDGILALTAALTANPEASAWAFTEFQPGTETVTDGNDDDHAIGKFTHYLFFEHKFPGGGSDDGSVGMTASLTALTAAIDATTDASGEVEAPDGSPLSDSRVLQNLARSLQDQSECSWDPRDYGHCVVEAWEAVSDQVQRWGHSVLDVLSLATFIPGLTGVALAAAATNATWYAIEGDYTNAGLSLAAAVPGLAFTKLVKGAKAAKSAGAAAAVEKAATEADDVARVANEIRGAVGTGSTITRPVTTDYLGYRPSLRVTTKEEIREAAPKNSDGDFIDPNTGQVVPSGAADIGHKPGHEWRCIKEKALTQAWTVQEFLDYINDPELYQMEDPVSNRSHQYEADACAV